MAPPGPATKLYGFNGLLRLSPRSLAKSQQIRENGWNDHFASESKGLHTVESNPSNKLHLNRTITNTSVNTDDYDNFTHKTKNLNGSSSEKSISPQNISPKKVFGKKVKNRRSHHASEVIKDKELITKG